MNRLRAARSRGFSLVEMLIVLMILGMLARIAIPAYTNLVRNARAAQIAADFNTVRAAAFAYHAATNAWPPECGTGVVPPVLVPYLPRSFSFVKPAYSLDWENWVLPSGTPQYPSTQVMLGISVCSSDSHLGNRVVNLLGQNTVHYTMNDSYTFVISSTIDGMP